ncbi:MAG: hypothetical protein MZV70_63395 [Desulfobacterales bacterium]|nr:hypothetical protein [Desulfobacterales bacterium]
MALGHGSRPGALRLWLVAVGHPGLHFLGGGGPVFGGGCGGSGISAFHDFSVNNREERHETHGDTPRRFGFSAIGCGVVFSGRGCGAAVAEQKCCPAQGARSVRRPSRRRTARRRSAFARAARSPGRAAWRVPLRRTQQMIPANEPSAPAACFYSRLQRGEGRQGAGLRLTDTGALDMLAGRIGTLLTVTGGTDLYDGASGYLIVHGSFGSAQ